MFGEVQSLVATPLVSFFHNQVLLERNTAMTYSFTPKQAMYAKEVAMMLWRKRCFLPRRTDRYPLPHLPVEIFKPLYQQNQNLITLYEDVAREAQKRLLDVEKALRLEPPRLSDGQQTADTNLFGNGLDIVAIVPLQALLRNLPHNQSELADELLDLHYPPTRRDDVTPSHIRERREAFKRHADGIFDDDLRLSHGGNLENKFMVVLETRFEPATSGLFENDFMKGKLDGLITYPHLASYLFYKHALSGATFTEKAFIIFTSAKSGHIAIDFNDDITALIPDKKYGYDCKIAFATIL